MALPDAIAGIHPVDDGGVRVGSSTSSRRSALGWLPALISGGIRVIDCGVLLAAAAVAYWVYVEGRYEPSEAVQFLYYMLPIVAAVLQLNIFQFSGLYRFKRLTNIAYQTGRILVAVGMLFLVLVALLYISGLSITYSRGWMLTWCALTVGGLLAVRMTFCAIVHRMIAQGHLAQHIAVIGCGTSAQRFVSYLTGLPSGHVRVVGMFEDRPTKRNGETTVRPNGTIDDLRKLAQNHDIDTIIIALPNLTEERLDTILGKLKSLPVDIRLCKETFEHSLPQSSYEFCGTVPLLRLYDRPVNGWGLVAKSIEDKVLATLLLLFFGPLMLCIAALIRIESPGPALFKQKRYGFNNRLITVWKFRTMRQDATDAGGKRQTTKNDPRVTPFGGFLRATSLDELPQLINVLSGDMSIVGPRPHPVLMQAAGKLYKNAVKEYAARHRVKPGITGWAQVNGWRGETDTMEKAEERVKHDLYYIDNWSVLFDLKILLMTMYIVFNRKNAY